MELPKNITQIGESDQHCKIYVEDYVISYMKQLNRLAMDKEMAVALYGRQREENGVSFLFLYGACRITFLQKETRHLSQAQQQEIEKLRKLYFPEYVFLGYRLLNGEMIEGFHICEQNICRYISGYAQFYEKNDNMLAYMLDMREEAPAPTETVDQGKYDEVRKRQEERRAQHEESLRSGRGRAARTGADKSAAAETPREPSRKTPHSIRGIQVAVVAVFALLCLLGLSTMNSSKMEELQVAARRVVEDTMEQRIPDAEDGSGDAADVDTLIAEDRLAEAVAQENQAAQDVQQAAAPGVADNGDSAGSTAAAADSAGVAPQEDSALQGDSGLQGGESADTANGAGSAQDGTAQDGLTQNGSAQQDSAQDSLVQGDSAQSGSAQGNSAQTAESGQEDTQQASQTAANAAPASYTIQKGDTLTGISLRNYGTAARVAEICSLNGIADPDDIKVGQTIRLP